MEPMESQSTAYRRIKRTREAIVAMDLRLSIDDFHLIVVLQLEEGKAFRFLPVSAVPENVLRGIYADIEGEMTDE